MGLNTVSAYGDSWGYTIVNFILMYIIGAYIRLEEIHIKKRCCLPVIALLTILLAYTGSLSSGGYAWSYCNPLVIAQASAVFLLFRDIKIKSRIINELAKGAFTCFLFHGFVLPRFGAQIAATKSTLYLLGHILFTCVSIYLLSWVLFKIYHFITRPIIELLDRICDRLRLNAIFQSL